MTIRMSLTTHTFAISMVAVLLITSFEGTGISNSFLNER